jgi:hypothetical protein
VAPPSSTLRRIKIRVKQVLDLIRPYPYLTRFCPRPAWTAGQLGSVIHTDARIRGPLRVWEPAWFQMNRHSVVHDVNIPGKHFLFVGEQTRLEHVTVHDHTFALSDRRLTGKDRTDKSVTLSVDLEGCVPFCSADTIRGRQLQKAALKKAKSLYAMLGEHRIPSTWYIVGSLFDDPDMAPFCETLMADPAIDIGWHSQDHLNYFLATPAAVERDMDHARRVRDRFNLPLDAMAFPFNALGHLDRVLSSGFNKIRGFVGQLYLPFTVDFDGFTFLGASQFLGPQTVEATIAAINRYRMNMNLFMHPVDWVNDDLAPVARVMQAILRRSAAAR